MQLRAYGRETLLESPKAHRADGVTVREVVDDRADGDQATVGWVNRDKVGVSVEATSADAAVFGVVPHGI